MKIIKNKELCIFPGPFQAYFRLLGMGILLLASSCFRLDSNLFNPDNSISEYLLEDYQGEVAFSLDAGYAIADSLRTLFTLQSQGPDESEAYTIHALYIGDISRIATDTVFLYLHGNASHIDGYWQRAKLLANTGGKNRYGVLMIDYRGYGLSEGKPTEAGLYHDTRSALQWLRDRGLSSDRLLMYGFSLGTAPATELTANPAALTPSWLILEAPFASIDVMVNDASGLAMPASFMTHLEIDNAEEIKKVNQPFLWFHGMDDSFIRMETHGEVVYKNYQGERGMAVRVAGAEHSTVPNTMGFQAYLAKIEELLKP